MTRLDFVKTALLQLQHTATVLNARQLEAMARHNHRNTPVISRCTNSKCTKHSCYFSLRDGTVFENSNLSIEKVLIVANLFVSKITSYQQIQDQCQLSGETKLSSETISDWLS